MVVISFLLVIIAAVTLIIGLFQDGIEWIWASIASCVLAMVFLGIGVLQRRSTPTASLTGDDDEDEYTPGAISSLVGDDEEAEDEDEVEAAPEEPEVEVVPKRRAAEPTGDDQPEGADDGTTIVPRVSAAERTAAEPAEAAPRTTGEAARERLSQIDGLGAAKVDALLDHFGSLEAVVMASTEELTVVDGIGTGTAQRVKGGLAGGRPARKKTAKKATAKKTAKKATAKKTAKKATAKKTAKKAAAKKTAKKRTAKKATRGAAARDRLTQISGVSAARADALIDRFGSLEAVASASTDDLTEVKGIGASIAERISAEL